jgi:hypothetical protein
MNEPWFSESYAWLPGTVLGCVAGLWGALVGTCAWRGKAKGLITGLYWLLLLGSAAMLVAGLTALIVGQPYGVWYGLGLAGLLGVLVLSFNGIAMFNAYRRAEARQLTAENL